MRRGFTLVEMLVSTALVMLIMILFAEVFQQAIGTVRTQRGLIANDEKARAVISTLGGDLSRATFRTSVGRGASLQISAGGALFIESPQGLVALSASDRVDPRQRGYLSFSENDPTDDTDDTLSMTVSVDETLRNPLISDPSQALYTGRARAGNLAIPNQPDLDDGRVDGAASSRAAEVCYFLRGTTLYRRVLLLRDPLPSGSPPNSTQPTDTTGAPLWPTYSNQYRDFDFAATNIDGQLHFHGLESLDNARGLSNAPLAAPAFRFGHLVTNGQPREFDSAGNYYGLFTQEETSFEGPNGLGQNGFRWPGVNDGANSNIIDSPLVMSPAGVVAVDTNTNNTFETGTDIELIGSRSGEDILMTGVETFNIEVWDPAYTEDVDGDDLLDPGEDRNGNNSLDDEGMWVDLGNGTDWGLFAETSSGPAGSNNTWGRQNAAYGSGGPGGNHVYDTWHPSLGGSAPYRPLQVAAPTGYFWQPNAVVTAGSVFMPDIYGLDGAPGEAGVDDNGDTTTDFVSPGVPDTAEVGYAGTDDNRTYGFIAVEAVSATGGRQPEWPRETGALVRDGGVVWQCFDNRVGLEKIRVTIRFRDPGTGQARQVTLVHAFTE